MFERLTIKTDICIEPENEIVYHNPNDPEGMYNILDLAECLYSGGEAEAGILMEISRRLAAYEDSGLSPEEVQELAKAKEEGRLVVLPNIKLYKTLYWIWGDEIMPVKYKGVHHGCIDEGKYHVVCRMTTKKPRTFVHRKKEFTYPAGNERWFYADDIGKTVFLTREEAEKALGGDTP